jgi:endoglucanase
LSKDKDKTTQKIIDTLCVDTGLDDQKVQELLPIGTPGAFFAPTTKLLNNRIAPPFLDDKICIAAICECCARLSENPPKNTDIYVLLSAGEEKGQLGARTALASVLPDACVVLDVNFAKEKGSKETEYIPMDKGPGVSVSSCTHRRFTDFIFNTAKKENIPCSKIVEMTNTGTNAQVLARESVGIATAVVSVPLKYMHSGVECASLDDVVSTSELLCAVAHGFEDFDGCGEKYFVKGGKSLE